MIFFFNPFAWKNESFFSNKQILILFCLVGLSGEIDGLVFVELQVHWRWCGNDVYHTGRVYLSSFRFYTFMNLYQSTNFSLISDTNGQNRKYQLFFFFFKSCSVNSFYHRWTRIKQQKQKKFKYLVLVFQCMSAVVYFIFNIQCIT